MSTPSSALALTGLAVEYCRELAAAEETDARTLLGQVLRYLPRIYVTISDLEGLPEDSGAIYATVTEELYDKVRADVSRTLGEDDVFLDTAVEDMKYSDVPVAVSLAELLADIFQAMADYAAAMAQATEEAAAEIIADLKARFEDSLADTICRALRAANYIYYSR